MASETKQPIDYKRKRLLGILRKLAAQDKDLRVAFASIKLLLKLEGYILSSVDALPDKPNDPMKPKEPVEAIDVDQLRALLDEGPAK